jgi:WD40 repeat protein/serine/threonine protein kinase
MNPTAAPDSASVENLLAQITDEFLQRLDAGEQPDIEEYAHRYPAIAEVLRQVLPALHVLRGPAAATDAADVATAGCLGDFRILREVGRGGMGVVYEAEQMSLRRRVALKMLPFAATMDPRHLQRFHNEARAAACLDHPHIVKVHAVSYERSVHFYAMQFIEGQSLDAFLRQLRQDAATAWPAGSEPDVPSRGPASGVPAAEMAETRVRATTQLAPRDAAYFRRVAAWGIAAAEALEHAHSLGIVHRDIKPANLMIDGAGKLWVTDFGLARTATDAGLTMTGDVVGTLRYMSPEQALAKHGLVDHRSDTYSLGATLYELLTLRPAVDGKDREEILGKISFEEPPSPRSLDRTIPADLETIVLKALAKEPSERYATAQEMADDLRRFLEDRPIRARRQSWLKRIHRWVRRQRAVVAAASTTLAVALAVGAVLIWRERVGTLSALHDAQVQRDRAEVHRGRAEERELLARRQLYAAHIAAAQRAWMSAELGVVQSLLEQYIPRPGEVDLRGFEWYYLWGIARGRTEALRILRGHSGDVYCVQFSPDGKLLATSGQDHTVRLWDPARGQARAVLRGHGNEVNWVAFAPEGGTLASAGDDGAVKLWDLASGRETSQILKSPVPVIGVAFSPDGKVLAAGLKDGTVRWWDRPSGRERPPFRAHANWIESITFSPDSRTLATSAENVKLWYTATGKLQRIMPVWPAGHIGSKANFIRFNHRGDVVAAPSRVDQIQLFDAASGQPFLRLASFNNQAQSAAFSPDDRILAVAQDDGAVRLWHARTGQMLEMLGGHAGRVWCVAYAPDGRTLATAGKDGTVRLWDPDARQDRKVLATPLIDCLTFSPDGKRIVVGGLRKNEHGLTIWEIPSGQRKTFLPSAHTVRSLALSPDGRVVAAGSHDGLVTVWDLDKERPRLTFRAGDSGVRSLAFTADGQTLLTGGTKNMVRQWEVSTGRLRRDLILPHLGLRACLRIDLGRIIRA